MSTSIDTKVAWDTYCTEELLRIRPILKAHGFTLDEVQPHLQGERYLMHAVTTTSGKKLILLGKDATGKRVVIKATRDDAGIAELIHERKCRTLITAIDFAGEVFHTPQEIVFLREDSYALSVQEYIEQTCSFLERPIEEQFALALRAFKDQESAHATTWKHRARVQDVFGMRDVTTYHDTFLSFKTNIQRALPEAHHLHTLMASAMKLLTEHRITIEQYTGFLTHTDFVPHNIRIKDDTLYLLDYSSLTFGNKYEGWARFLNFMTLHNPSLEHAFVQYVSDNRTPEESIALRMMRIYRLGEIIWYYARTLESSSGNLLALNTTRVHFWGDILTHLLTGNPIPQSVIDAYKAKRDSLRSDEEKQRQQGLH